MQAMDRAIVFLESLKHEPIPTNPIEVMSVKEKTPSSKHSRIDNINISGSTVILGDGNRVSQVYIRELIEAIAQDVRDKIPEGEERKSVLESLKKLTTNPTFAEVSGAFVGEALKRLARP